MSARFCPRPSRFRLSIESLEDRLAPATFTVTNVDDSGDGSLRWAITQANLTAGPDTIAFGIEGEGVHSIVLLAQLPTITAPVTIAGNTQTGFSGTPLIRLNGFFAGAGAHGLEIAPGGSGSIVRKLIINRFGGDGLRISADNCRVTGNFIGTTSDGLFDLGNSGSGVVLFGGASGNVIGGTLAAARNVISGNNADGVRITDAGTSGNTVLGNFIGLAGDGTDCGNSLDGVRIRAGASGNTIGGTVAGSRNIIAGNDDIGVLIHGTGTAGNRVKGNHIGIVTDGDATLDRGNTFQGVAIVEGASGNTIGGTAAAARNIISGNNQHGVLIQDDGTTANRVLGNRIGTDPTGMLDFGNAFNGVQIEFGATNNVIGGTAAGSRNIISGNGNDGVFIQTIGTSGNRVLGNYIGTNRTGTAGLGNSEDGVQVAAGASGNFIGGAAAGAGNVISGNDVGVALASVGTTDNRVKGNFIGTNRDGTGEIGNVLHGVAVTSGAANNVVGGLVPAARNVISGNHNRGVVIAGPATTGNKVLGNRIGVTATSTSALPNASDGVLIIDSASGNLIGDRATGAGNIIARNGVNGVRIESGTGNSVLGNRIFANNDLGIDLGTIGVTANDTTDPIDGDSGANDLLNFPDLDLARLTASGLRVRGTMTTGMNKELRIEFFASPAGDPSGNGEGKRFLGYITVLTGDSNTVNFSTLLPSLGILAGQVITATATDEAGNTSEFSATQSVV